MKYNLGNGTTINISEETFIENFDNDVFFRNKECKFGYTWEDPFADSAMYDRSLNTEDIDEDNIIVEDIPIEDLTEIEREFLIDEDED